VVVVWECRLGIRGILGVSQAVLAFGFVALARERRGVGVWNLARSREAVGEHSDGSSPVSGRSFNAPGRVWNVLWLVLHWFA